jgi:hypothetical protein
MYITSYFGKVHSDPLCEYIFSIEVYVCVCVCMYVCVLVVVVAEV